MFLAEDQPHLILFEMVLLQPISPLLTVPGFVSHRNAPAASRFTLNFPPAVYAAYVNAGWLVESARVQFGYRFRPENNITVGAAFILGIVLSQLPNKKLEYRSPTEVNAARSSETAIRTRF